MATEPTPVAAEPATKRFGPSVTFAAACANLSGLMESSLREAVRRQSYFVNARAVGVSDEDASRVLNDVVDELLAAGLSTFDADPCAIAWRRLQEGPGQRPPEHLREAARQLLAAGGHSLHPEIVDEQARALQRLLLTYAELHRLHRACFCHTKPFPAARDYRRRTKHRNRRRKR